MLWCVSLGKANRQVVLCRCLTYCCCCSSFAAWLAARSNPVFQWQYQFCIQQAFFPKGLAKCFVDKVMTDWSIWVLHAASMPGHFSWQLLMFSWAPDVLITTVRCYICFSLAEIHVDKSSGISCFATCIACLIVLSCAGGAEHSWHFKWVYREASHGCVSQPSHGQRASGWVPWNLHSNVWWVLLFRQRWPAVSQFPSDASMQKFELSGDAWWTAPQCWICLVMLDGAPKGI